MIYMKTPARNGWIDLWRFLASIIIVLFHFGGKGSLRFPSGGLFVEFYFILTGFWACSWLERQPPDGEFLLFHRRYRGPAGLVLKYMSGWYAKVVPYAAFGVTLLYAVGFCQKNFTALQILKFIGQTPFEFLLLQNAGVVRSWAYVMWYLSAAVLFASPLLYLAAARPDLFFSYGVLIGPWLCHGYLLQTAGTLRVNSFGIATPLRVWGGILAGGLAYLFANYIRQLRITDTVRNFLSALEVCLFGGAVFSTMVRAWTKSFADETFVLLVVVSLSLSLSGQTWTSRGLTGRFTSYLSKLSLPIYCSHWGVFTALKPCLGIYDCDVKIWTGLLVVGLLAALQVFLVEHMLSRLKVNFVGLLEKR